jgi:lipid-binding SYLF domain-containing protein
MKMKTITLSLCVLCLAGPAFCADKAELDAKIRMLATKLETLQDKPDKAVPPADLNKAVGIILLDRTKAGFFFAYEGGGGVALLKDPIKKTWGPVAFLAASDASVGPQIGGQQSFYAILLMNTNAIRILTEPNYELGGDAQGTAGQKSAGVGDSISSVERPVLIYNDSTGLYAGASVKAGSISPDDKANIIYYGRALTIKDILLLKKVEPTPAAVELAAILDKYSKPPKK